MNTHGTVEDGWGKVADAFRANFEGNPGEAGASCCGHPGSGGSIGWADPDAGVGFGYAMNHWSFRVGEPRASSLAAAVKACLG